MRLGLSDEALKREATEAARGSRRERHLKVLERRQEQHQHQQAMLRMRVLLAVPPRALGVRCGAWTKAAAPAEERKNLVMYETSAVVIRFLKRWVRS